ncbi:MAG: BlaI/MecI/CopY family transcriptional regulator [Bacteroidaceae bacterium]|nr:BlaI/MecI/CopY family transcriptional regulator [Bacteroidaceae bacterium]
MKHNNEERQLTRAEMEIMNILWSPPAPEGGGGLTTHQIIEQYPEPKPAYSTIATFLKILTNKGFITSRKQEGGGKTFVFTPLITREAYTQRVMKEVKSTFFAGSFKSMLSFFAKQEEVSEEDLKEIVELINNKQK